MGMIRALFVPSRGCSVRSRDDEDQETIEVQHPRTKNACTSHGWNHRSGEDSRSAEIRIEKEERR